MLIDLRSLWEPSSEVVAWPVPDQDLEPDEDPQLDLSAQTLDVAVAADLDINIEPVDVDLEQPEADADDQVAQVAVDAEGSALPIDEQAEEPDQDADTPALLVEDAQAVTPDTGLELTEVSTEEEPDPGEEAPVALTEDVVVFTSDVGLELTEGADDEQELGDDGFIVVVLGDETTLVLTEQDDEPELDTLTLEAPTQPDDPATPDNIEPALLAWVDLDEFHPDLEFGLEILIGPTDDPPAQTNYVWIHRARRRGIR